MNYVFVLQHRSMDILLYKDILEQENVNSFLVSAPMGNKLIYMIRRVHTSTVATKYFDPPFKSFWYEKDLLNSIKDGDCVVFQIAPMMHVGKKVIEKIKKTKPNTKIGLLLVDSMHAHSMSMKYAKRYIEEIDWDVILSFDEADCKEFGFTFMGFSYYSKLEVEADTSGDFDLYYIGAIKDEDSRVEMVQEICKKAMENDLLVSFELLVGGKSNINKNIKQLSKPKPYEKVLEDIQNTNCILEIIQPGQNNQTARYMEAVCYNKKLLSNNKNLNTLPYFDSKFMKVFSSADDIDFNWVKDNEKVDYHYAGDFSPLRILEIIEESLREKK